MGLCSGGAVGGAGVQLSACVSLSGVYAGVCLFLPVWGSRVSFPLKSRLGVPVLVFVEFTPAGPGAFSFKIPPGGSSFFVEFTAVFFLEVKLGGSGV